MSDAVVTARKARHRLVVRGLVQGVGFRPFVHREAARRGLAGWVCNGPEGVVIEVEGDPAALAGLRAALATAAPPGARVADVLARELPGQGETGFRIRESVVVEGPGRAVVPLDRGVCEACLAELRDRRDRRYRYPFISCTDCGPRYTVLEALPFDRARTSLREFPLCADCAGEFADPGGRRFHAQTIACAACGPTVTLLGDDGVARVSGDAAVVEAVERLRRGAVLAVQGVGGFQLIADATGDIAVAALRARKGRPHKPFAVLFRDAASVARAAHLGEVERALLTGPERPVVLLRLRGRELAEGVAPRCPDVGALLPASGLQYLLAEGVGRPLVATSGNRSGEPIAAAPDEAVRRLAGFADAFLVHDCRVRRAVDDSVVRVVDGRPLMLRRARGYAPSVVPTGPREAGWMALGGHSRVTLAQSTAAGVVVGPHIGDLDGPLGRAAHRAAVGDLAALHGVAPARLVRDRHPDYASTRLAEESGLPCVAVAHHVAHLAAACAEHGLDGPVLGVVWDGTGDGGDGTVWGGEFLRLHEGGWERVAHLRPFRLPGGEAAVRAPFRAALGVLHARFGPSSLSMAHLPPVAMLAAPQRRVMAGVLRGGVNAPWTSSAGRLFDAVASLCDLRQAVTYDGQAAAELEWAAHGVPAAGAYPFTLTAADGQPAVVDWAPALDALLADRVRGVAVGVIAARFHAGLAGCVADVARTVGEPRVVLTGGCFQNARLLAGATAALTAAGFRVTRPEAFPPNDGGLALGQIAWVARTGGEAVAPCV